MKKKNLFTKSFAFVFSLALLGSCAVTGGEQGEGEWYGVGIDVDLSSRTEFLEGEKVDPSMFILTAYEDGEEITPDPSEVTIEPARSLTKEDKQLTFKWKKYTTTLDINVSDTMISECELMDKAIFKYNEPEHTLNSQGNTPDPTSDNPDIRDVDGRSASRGSRKNSDGTFTGYLGDVSYGSNFSYTINTENEGDELYIYASVASNSYHWGAVSDKYKSGLNGSNALPLSNVYELSNNGNVVDNKKAADIKETMVTEAELDKIPSASTENPWFATVDLCMKNFKRHWLGKVTLTSGVNNIKIDFNKNQITGGRYAYLGAACGNWDNIEVRYVKKGESLSNAQLVMADSPKQEYLVGDKFSLDGAYFYLEDENGLTADVDISKIQISNTGSLTPADTSIDLIYDQSKITIPLKVKTKVIGDLGSTDSVIKYVEPVHDRDKNNKVEGEDGFTSIDTKSAAINTTVKKERFLENASAYGKFTYSYNSSKSGAKFDIYASVASNGYISGDVGKIWPGAKGGFIGSREIDFTKFMTLKNNSKSFSINENAVIPQTNLTNAMDPASIGAAEAVKNSAWGACTYFLLNNFRRIHIGTVDIVEGQNDIEINLNYNKGGFGYASSLCGNWKSIELIYVDENTDKSITNIEMTKEPTKSAYVAGNKFSIEGAEFIGYNSDGVEIGKIDNSKIKIIDNGPLYESGKVRLKYEDIEFTVDVSVSNSITQPLNKVDFLNSPNNMTISYHNATNGTTGFVSAAGGYFEKVSTGSYFEYVIESDRERTITVSAEVATNAYLYNTSELKYNDYDTKIDGFTQGWIGSYDLEMSKVVELSNTVNGEKKVFETNKDAIAKGHIINAEDDGETAKKYLKADGTLDQWRMADDLCMRQFATLTLGTITLSAGVNTIRLTMTGYLKKNQWALNGISCGNWKSVTLSID